LNVTSFSGPDTVCQYATEDYVELLSSYVSGADYYRWQVPSDAQKVFAGNNVYNQTTGQKDSTLLSVRFGTVSGFVKLIPHSVCGTSKPDTLKQYVLVINPPVANAGGKLVNATDLIKTYPTVLTEDPINLNGTGSSQTTSGNTFPRYTYTWTANPTTAFTSGNSLNPGITPTVRETKVYINVSNGYCSARDSALVILDLDYIPKAFSPNGDDVNETWQIDNLYLYNNFKLTVYNKWGSPVKEFTSYPRDPGSMWDGTVNGVKLPEAVYYYVLDFNGENGKSPRKGQVTIVR
jgi:gliding motility-associated-like protein